MKKQTYERKMDRQWMDIGWIDNRSVDRWTIDIQYMEAMEK